MIRVVQHETLSEEDRSVLFARGQPLDSIGPGVQEIMDAVRAGGDDVLRTLTERFDGVRLAGLQVSPEEFDEADRVLDLDVREALVRELEAVRTFHEAQLPQPQPVETAAGVQSWREWRPIERVGLYVPGGRGAYPSSVVMLGVPAVIAGCSQVVLCTPPSRDGSVPAATLVAAKIVGIHRVFKLGGSQAIAAMAFGTQTVPKVDKLFGAGNSYVTAAKLLAFPECSIDVPAGPSELLIIADDTAEAAWIAADLLSDAEHGPDSPAVLVTPSIGLAERVTQEIERQLETLPRRDIAREALQAHGRIVLTRDLDCAAQLADEYAPEHLEIICEAPRRILALISNAASIFLGPHSPNAAGDYATGTNHVLPTAGYARTFGAVSVESFGRLIQVQELSAEGLASLAPTVGALAREEGLEGHARAVETRFRGAQ